MKRSLIPLTFLLVLLFSFASFAANWGSWVKTSNGWMWCREDGTYPRNEWVWIDGNNDGISECYCFNENGICYVNTKTPDGYMVNENGAWIINGQVQTENSGYVGVNPLVATDYPSRIGINLGTPLSDALKIFKANRIDYQADGSHYHYFDNKGWIITYAFDDRGICCAATVGVGAQSLVSADMYVETWMNNIPIPLVKHYKTDTYEWYDYQDDTSEYIILKELQDYGWFVGITRGLL